MININHGSVSYDVDRNGDTKKFPFSEGVKPCQHPIKTQRYTEHVQTIKHVFRIANFINCTTDYCIYEYFKTEEHSD
jgi:hypothetical protein